MNSDVTMVIPVFNLNDKRLRNFKFLFDNYISKLDLPVIIAEQVYKRNPPSKVLEHISPFNVKYCPVLSNRDLFHKSHVLNWASRFVDTKYLWMIDADVFLKYKDVLNLLIDQDVVQPHEHIFLLDENQTRGFIDNKKFIAQEGMKIRTMKKFGPLTFIIKTEIYKQNPMDERFIGWGWEDMDFAYRLSLEYKVTNLGINGLHLYHDVSPHNPEQEKVNRKIFFKKRQELTFKKLKFDETQIKQILSSTDIINNLKAEGAISETKIVHIIAPALLPSKKELFHREILAIESIIKEKKHYPNLVNIMACESPEAQKYREHFDICFPTRSSRDLGDERALPYLPDLLKKAGENCGDNDIVFYTNSDCCLAPGTYGRLENTKTMAIEYHRRDVLNDPRTLSDIFDFPNQLKETGIDGIAFRKNFFDKNSYFVPDFFVGEPHWDTAVCGALRTAGVSSQNIIDLFHPIHKQAWDTKRLSIAGKQNDRLYRDFLEYGISKIDVLSAPKEKIKTSVVLVYYGSDEKRISAAKRAMSHLSYQNILDTEFVFVETVKGKTSFPEIDNKPNWRHVVLEEKEENKDIFQKEAMMNKGAKMAKGKIIIFLDADIWTGKNNWLDQISLKVEENNLKLVHGFSFCQDSKNHDSCFVSLGLNTLKNIESSFHENPGLVIGISKDVLEKNDYINIYSIMGGGDSMLMHEYVSPNYKHCEAWFQAGFPKLKKTLRNLPICCIFDYVDCLIFHENHGDVNFDYYGARHHATKYFTKEIQELLVLGENGLLEWVDKNCVEKKIIKERFLMTTEVAVRDICSKITKGLE